MSLFLFLYHVCHFFFFLLLLLFDEEFTDDDFDVTGFAVDGDTLVYEYRGELMRRSLSDMSSQR